MANVPGLQDVERNASRIDQQILAPGQLRVIRGQLGYAGEHQRLLMVPRGFEIHVLSL
jgi:hypothetical protein